MCVEHYVMNEDRGESKTRLLLALLRCHRCGRLATGHTSVPFLHPTMASACWYCVCADRESLPTVLFSAIFRSRRDPPAETYCVGAGLNGHEGNFTDWHNLLASIRGK